MFDQILLHFYFPDPPEVTLTYGSDTVMCSSNANPTVPEPSGYKIIINDTDEYEPDCKDGECTLELKVEFETDVRCNATNTIGTETKTVVAVPGKLGFLRVFSNVNNEYPSLYHHWMNSEIFSNKQ